MSVGNVVSKDDFLKLFTIQLQYQDPLKPMDSTNFTAQLAQFSSLEQLFNINKNIEQIATQNGSFKNFNGTELIGKKVKTKEGEESRIIGINLENGRTDMIIENNKIISMAEIKEILI